MDRRVEAVMITENGETEEETGNVAGIRARLGQLGYGQTGRFIPSAHNEITILPPQIAIFSIGSSNNHLFMPN